jgi:hypothetical protein
VSARAASRLAWALFGLAVALATTGLALGAARDVISTNALAALIPAVGAGGVGAVLASRLPRNPLGWIFIAAALAASYDGFATEYGIRGLRVDPGSLPAVEVVVWLVSWFWIPTFGTMLVFVFLLFPEGRLASPTWRPLAWLGGVTIALLVLGRALSPGPLREFPEQDNPIGIGGAGGLLDTLEAPLLAALLLAVLASWASLFVRLRSARGEARQQLKWFAFAAVVLAVLVTTVGPLWSSWAPARFLIFAALFGMVVAVAVAVLKYRLYDLDLVIRRTVIYGALTALLAGAYLGLVLVFQAALSPLAQESDLAIAASTLAVAALFRPARSRIQALVDRRFYRRRYDAGRTAEAFGHRLRDEVELDALSLALRGVAAETMEPAHVSLWLRERKRA